MPGIGHDVIFGLRRQSLVHILGVPRMREKFVVVATPKLDRGLDAGERFRREGVTDGGSRDHGGRDALVMHERGRRRPCFGLVFLGLATGPFVRMSSTIGRDPRQVRNAADRHQRGEAAG